MQQYMVCVERHEDGKYYLMVFDAEEYPSDPDFARQLPWMRYVEAAKRQCSLTELKNTIISMLQGMDLQPHTARLLAQEAYNAVACDRPND